MALFDENFETLEKWKWVRYNGKQEVTLVDFINMYPDSKFYIGSDSQKHSTRKKKGKKHWKFTTCLIAHNQTRGGSVIMSSEVIDVPHHLKGRLTREQRLPILRQRLLHEATRSLHVAWFLTNTMRINDIEVHVDVNSNSKWDSARYKDEIVGYVTAQGFDCEHKPKSWAASWIADGKC